jgi:hypothetical protein
MSSFRQAEVQWSVVTASGLRDRCRDKAHAIHELAKWKEYTHIESRIQAAPTPWIKWEGEG